MPLSPTHSYSLCYRSSFPLLMIAEHNCLQASSSQHHETLIYKYLKISCSPPNLLLNSILGLRIQVPSIAIQCTLLENCWSSLIPEFSSLLAPGRKSNVAQIKGHRPKNLTGLDFGSAIYQLCDLKNIQFSHSVMSDSFQPHELQHTRPPCLSPTPRVYPNTCPLSQWCHPTISSSVDPFSSCPQSFPGSGSFQMSQLFTSGGQIIEVSTSTSFPSMNTQDWSPLGWTGLISLQSKGLSRVFSNTTVQKHQFSGAQLSL